VHQTKARLLLAGREGAPDGTKANAASKIGGSSDGL